MASTMMRYNAEMKKKISFKSMIDPNNSQGDR